MGGNMYDYAEDTKGIAAMTDVEVSPPAKKPLQRQR
jgi:hypothetical protein